MINRCPYVDFTCYDNTVNLSDYNAKVGKLNLWATEAEQNIKKLQAFKDFVHNKLNELGVPEDPNPQMTKITGCRIGPRLDWLADQSK